MDHRFDQISPTAKLVAYMRSLSDIPYSSEIANLCAAESAVQEFYGSERLWLQKRIPLAELRFKSLTSLLVDSGVDQIVELASGLSPRGLILTENPAITFIETDLPEILEEK